MSPLPLPRGIETIVAACGLPVIGLGEFCARTDVGPLMQPWPLMLCVFDLPFGAFKRLFTGTLCGPITPETWGAGVWAVAGRAAAAAIKAVRIRANRMMMFLSPILARQKQQRAVQLRIVAGNADL